MAVTLLKRQKKLVGRPGGHAYLEGSGAHASARASTCMATGRGQGQQGSHLNHCHLNQLSHLNHLSHLSHLNHCHLHHLSHLTQCHLNHLSYLNHLSHLKHCHLSHCHLNQVRRGWAEGGAAAGSRTQQDTVAPAGSC